ncbi:hypothetical protein NQ314_008751 [Rhamnusium bicolor]|uniref:Uncharacterized protein n=1 Tax=Rhamnusium bicolor TaxID=1586634 RepID=A0AAV8Y730_9CUCU|nr:hypothetical protein NQ314_008751 [Rhamnusium bicolor]
MKKLELNVIKLPAMKGFVRKKKKNEPVAVEGYFFDKTENVEGQNKKKKREKSPNETFENYDENNFEPVKHKKKKKKNTKEQNESTESVTENNHKIDVLESSCEFYEISMKKEKRKEPHDEYLVNEGNDNVNVKKKKKKVAEIKILLMNL